MKRTTVPKYYKTDGFENINGFSVSCNLVREKYNVHQHEYFELELIIEGESVHTLNGEKCNISKGDVIFVTPMDRHGYESCFIRTYTIHFSGANLSPIFKNALSLGKNRIIKNVDTVTQNYFKLAHKFFMETGAKYRDIKIKNLVELILLELMPDIFAESEKMPLINDRLTEAIGYINVNFTNEITLGTIEGLFGLSGAYFSRAFKNRVGKTFVNYISEKRIEYAKKLLLSGEKVIDTCYECGFSSERNFARRFRELVGMTPKEYVLNSKKEFSES
ncbi:MAG: helix-turn-helix transcriptional regulator [Clostridia bacterium]|nr:helix-turn-helix transcriptional regulator [Clostridia bacterium]